MLAASAEPTTQFTRRDAGRLIAASVGAHRGDVGDPRASTSCRRSRGSRRASRPRRSSQAPRAAEYTSDVLTKQQRDAASAAVEPQYDFTSAGAAAVAAQQLRELDTKVAPDRRGLRRRRHARGPRRDPRSRPAGALVRRPHDAPRPHRGALDGASATRPRGCSRRSSGPSCATARSRPISESIAGRMAGDLNADERALAAALIAPADRAQLVVLRATSRTRPRGPVPPRTSSRSSRAGRRARRSSGSAIASTTSRSRPSTTSGSTRAVSTSPASSASSSSRSSSSASCSRGPGASGASSGTATTSCCCSACCCCSRCSRSSSRPAGRGCRTRCRWRPSACWSPSCSTRASR